MNPKCAFCNKTVYPTEKLDCLDKKWHRGCFGCTVCRTQLTVRNYKGYNKNPYCKAHYPHLTATQVAQTVEGARLQSISKQQSTAEYHKDHNLAKGSKMSVADDPETQRQKKVSNQQSNAVYQNRAAQKQREESNRPEAEQQPAPGYRGNQQPSYNPPPQQPSYNPPPQQPAYQEPPPADYGRGYSQAPAAPQQDYDPQPEQSSAAGDLKQFKAMYDYGAADNDEVSFQEDDIFQGSIVDDGWLEGTVLSSGIFGMAPRNYFEEI